MKRLEEIHYRLDLQVSPQLEGKIVEAVVKLPEDVIDFVVDNVQFIEGIACMFRNTDIEKPFVIILRRNNSVFTIFHEIAHAWLKHETGISLEGKGIVEKALSKVTFWQKQNRQQAEANALAKIWLKVANKLEKR